MGPAAYDRKRIQHRRNKFRGVARQFHPADALEASGANRFQNKPRLRHQSRFNTAFRPDNHDGPFRSSGNPFPGDGQRGKYVPTRAASRDQQF